MMNMKRQLRKWFARIFLYVMMSLLFTGMALMARLPLPLSLVIGFTGLPVLAIGVAVWVQGMTWLLTIIEWATDGDHRL